MNNETILPCSFCGEVRELLKDARHRIANLSRAAVPFDDPLDGPVLRRLDAALAAQPSTSAEPMDYERRHAIKEGERNESAFRYFSARATMMDTPHNRRIFEAGFDRGYDAAPAASLAAQRSRPTR